MANTNGGIEFVLAVYMNDSMDVHVHSSVACRQLTERISEELPLAVRLERICKADHKPTPFELLTQKERNAILNVSLSILDGNLAGSSCCSAVNSVANSPACANSERIISNKESLPAWG